MTDDQKLDEQAVEEVTDEQSGLVPSDADGEVINTNADDFEDDGQPKSAKELEAIYDVPVKVQAVLGNSEMKVSQLLKLGRGAVVELDKKVGDAIDIYVNNRLVARGEVIIIEDKLGVSMTEIIKNNENAE